MKSLILVVVALAIAAPAPAQIEIGRPPQPVRTFPQFVGTWALDTAASTGRMSQAIPVSLTIATTATEVTVTKVLDLPPETPGREGKRLAANHPPPEVYRLNGAPTVKVQGPYEHTYTFALVADMLALTHKTVHWVRRDDPLMTNRDAFTMETDAYSVDGDVLTVRRQLTSVSGNGEILVMSTPAANSYFTYVYRRVRG